MGGYATILEMSKILRSQRGRRRGGKGVDCPPLLKRWEPSPSTFAVVTVDSFAIYSNKQNVTSCSDFFMDKNVSWHFSGVG